MACALQRPPNRHNEQQLRRGGRDAPGPIDPYHSSAWASAKLGCGRHSIANLDCPRRVTVNVRGSWTPTSTAETGFQQRFRRHAASDGLDWRPLLLGCEAGGLVRCHPHPGAQPPASHPDDGVCRPPRRAMWQGTASPYPPFETWLKEADALVDLD